MAYRKIEPKNNRTKIQLAGLGKKFTDAANAVKAYGKISPAEFGIYWNKCDLERFRKGAIEFAIAGENGSSDKTLNGFLKNEGYNEHVVRASKDVTGASFCNNYVISSLAETMDIAAKLEIIDKKILPSGMILDPRSSKGEISIPRSESSFTCYEDFERELIDSAEKIIVSKLNKDFGDYLVLETGKGMFIAYNSAYGEAPYIADRLDTLLRDKQDLKKSGDVIWFRRDSRGNWPDRIREFL